MIKKNLKEIRSRNIVTFIEKLDLIKSTTQDALKICEDREVEKIKGILKAVETIRDFIEII